MSCLKAYQTFRRSAESDSAHIALQVVVARAVAEAEAEAEADAEEAENATATEGDAEIADKSAGAMSSHRAGGLNDSGGSCPHLPVQTPLAFCSAHIVNLHYSGVHNLEKWVWVLHTTFSDSRSVWLVHVLRVAFRALWESG